jgi:hypothetical protein
VYVGLLRALHEKYLGRRIQFHAILGSKIQIVMEISLNKLMTGGFLRKFYYTNVKEDET